MSALLPSMSRNSHDPLPGDWGQTRRTPALQAYDGLRRNLPHGRAFHVAEYASPHARLRRVRGNLHRVCEGLRTHRRHGRLRQGLQAVRGKLPRHGRLDELTIDQAQDRCLAPDRAIVRGEVPFPGRIVTNVNVPAFLKPSPRVFMTIRAFLPAKGRDLRLDLFRGLANWAIFLDHVPNNAVAWLTTRNYGFSDAADIFVFISGYTAAFVYAKSMLVQGFVAGTARLIKRVWQLYIAHVLLFVFYIAAIGWVAEAYNHSHLVDEFNVAGLIDRPMLTLMQGLLLKFKPLNLDVLPLYIVLMAAFPLVLWLMLRRPDLAITSSLVLYFAARQFGWNLPAYPSGVWYFNPFTCCAHTFLGSCFAHIGRF